MTSTELVGPLPRIVFYGAGPYVAQGYAPPKHTGDLRARLCTDHHPACDCREAERAEEVHEYRAEARAIKEAAAAALAGHRTYYFDPDGEISYGRRCTCSGCVIARSCYGVRDLTDQWRERTPSSARDIECWTAAASRAARDTPGDIPADLLPFLPGLDEWVPF